MAITSSAKKALRASARKRVFNVRRARAIGAAVKQFKKFIAAKQFAEAEKVLPQVYQAYDKAAKEHTIHRGNAARNKSRLAQLLPRTA